MSQTPIAKRFQAQPRQRSRETRQSSCGDPAQGFEADAIDPVAEPFPGSALGSKRHEDRPEQRRYVGDGYVGCVDAVEARAVEIAGEHHVVLAERRADKPDVPEVRPRAAVGAAAHAKADALLGQTQLFELGCDLAYQPG